MAWVKPVGFFTLELKSCYVHPPMLQGVVGGAEILPNVTLKLEGGSELLLGWALPCPVGHPIHHVAVLAMLMSPHD